MTYFYTVPAWFFGFDVGMELLFSIITLAVAIVAYKVYRLSYHKNVKLYSTGFFLISLSYIFWAFMNLYTTNQLNNISTLSLQSIAFLGIVGLYAHMLLFTSGLVTLTYTTLKTNKGSIFYLMFGLSVLVIASSLHKYITFRILSTFLFAFLAYHYFLEYLDDRRSKNKKMLLGAFGLLFLSSVDLIFSGQYYQAYVLGHILELGAYSLILITLIKTLKK